MWTMWCAGEKVFHVGEEDKANFVVWNHGKECLEAIKVSFVREDSFFVFFFYDPAQRIF